MKFDLPLNQPVAIDLTMPASGEVAFACGMDMMHGSIVAD
jgi:plastocyanin domain-containing protein